MIIHARAGIRKGDRRGRAKFFNENVATWNRSGVTTQVAPRRKRQDAETPHSGKWKSAATGAAARNTGERLRRVPRD